MTITNSNTLSAVLLTLGLAGVGPTFGEPVVEVEHSDCIIEPMVVVEVGTSVAGVIAEMLVDRSHRVQSGQPLARLESSVEEVTLRRSEERADMVSEIRAREADLKLARQKMQRIGDLYARSMVSKQQRDEAVNELERADQAVKIAREKLRLAKLDMEHARAQLDRRLIRSPIKGVILERLAQVGEYVDERPLVTVAQLDPLRVEVLMPAQAFGSIQPGAVAKVMPELATSTPLDAKVVLVDPIIDTASGTFGIRLELPNTDYAIPSGMRCRVSFLDADDEQDSIVNESGEGLDESGFLSAPVRQPIATEPLTVTGSTPVTVKADAEPSLAETPEYESTPLEATIDTIEPEPSIDELPEPVVPQQALSYPTVKPKPTEPRNSRPVERIGPCWSLGPWSEADRRDVVAARLEPLGIEIEKRRDAGIKHDRWMVFVPGRGGLDTADRLTALAMAGLDDLYVIRRGKQRGDVSVGLFNRRANAERRVRELDELGFSAQVVRNGHTTTEYWLQVGAVTESVLQSLPGLSATHRTESACAEQNPEVFIAEEAAGQVVSRAD